MASSLLRWLKRLGAAALVAAALLLLLGVVFGKKPVSVRVTAVAHGRVEQTVTNSRAGTVKARRRAKLSPEIGGVVVALPHPEGSRVARGDVLLRIDGALQRGRLEVAERETTAASAQREQACLTAERAGRELLRTESLARDGILSADLLDQVRSGARAAEAGCQAAAAGVERARSAVGLTRTELDKTALFAPFDGVVAKLSIQVGEWTTPSPPGLPIPSVIDLIDPSSIYLSAPMDEVDSARIHAGQAARVTVDSHPGRSFPARVTRIAPYVLDVEAQNRTVEIEAELTDQELARTLLPGTSADVEVVLGGRDGVLRVPTTALLEGGRVLVIEGGRLAERRVKTGVRNWDFTEIESGLAEADRIVVSLDRPEVKAGARARVEAEPKP
jgi:HlyD family secretion protein